MMKACYFGTYDVDQPRNSVIIEGLRENGVEVVECRVDLWQDTMDKIKSIQGGFLNPRLLSRILISYFRLLKRYARVGDHDVMVVGYAGHLDMFLAKALTTFSKKPLAFDAFVSLTETIVEDRGLVHPDSFLAKLIYLLDRSACRLADLVFLDTEVHIQHFHEDLGVRLDKLRLVYAGAGNVYRRQLPKVNEGGSFRVLYFGKYIPLHGVNYIIEAAKILEEHDDIQFELVGKGQTYEGTVRLAEKLDVKNVIFHHTWLKAEALASEYIQTADVCLGIFGDTPKARRVVPLKVFAAFAMGKPVITGDSPAAREALVDGEDALLCEMGNAQALAQAILLLKRDRVLRERIAQGGYASFLQKFSPKAIGAMVRGYLDELC